jgi:hypothetical protein
LSGSTFTPALVRRDLDIQRFSLLMNAWLFITAFDMPGLGQGFPVEEP